MLWDLLSAQAGVLKHNVSADVAARYKRAAIRNVATLTSLARQHVPELGDRAAQLSAQVIMAIGAVWTHVRPSVAMLAAYDTDPALSALRMDFMSTLRELLATLVSGNLPRAKA